MSGTTFSTLDFAQLWSGRQRVTDVEQALLGELLSHSEGRRVLEAGIGAGRLTSTILRYAREYVGIDLTPSFVLSSKANAKVPSAHWATANILHLPFDNEAFSTIILFRVFNFLPDPERGLRELRRCLKPGGTLVVSHNDHPSIGTLANDLKIALNRPHGIRTETMTFTRKEIIHVQPSSFPAFSMTHESFDRLAKRTGYEVGQTLASGLEDNRLLRRFPTRLFVRLGTIFSKADAFSLHLTSLIKRVPPTYSSHPG